MSDFLKGLCAGAALVAMLFMAAPAHALNDIPTQTFAYWPPNYCAKGAGQWGLTGNYSGGTHVWLSVPTFSKKALTPGNCVTDSPASAGAFAAWGKVEKEGTPGQGNWYICKSAPWAGNGNGDADVFSYDVDLLLGCGSGRYRLRSENRITYSGNNYHSPPYVGNAQYL